MPAINERNSLEIMSVLICKKCGDVLIKKLDSYDCSSCHSPDLNITQIIIQPSISRTTDHVNFYTWGSFRGKLLIAGLVIIACHREGFFLPHMQLNRLFRGKKSGRWLLRTLRKVFPSQSGGLIVFASKV